MSKALPAEPTFWSALRSRGAVASLLRGTAGSCLNKVLANGLMFVAQIVLARQLGLEGFGIYALALAWLGVLVMVGRLGYDLATIRFVATYHAERAWSLLRGFLLSARATVLIASVVTGGALALGSVLLRSELGETLTATLVITGAILPILAMIQFEAAAIRGLGRVILGDIPFSIGHPLLLLGGFLGAILWFGAPEDVTTAMTAYFGASVACLVALIAILQRELPREARKARPEFRVREWLATASAMTFIAGFGVILNQSSTIIVGSFSGPEAAGIYGASTRIAGVLQVLVFSLVAAIGPLAVKLSTAGERQQLQRMIDAGIAAVFAAVLVASVAIAVLGRFVLGLFGPGFVEGYETVLILVAGHVLAAATAPAGILLNMTGHQNVSVRILAIAVLANLSLCTMLAYAWGQVGAAIAASVTTVLLNGAMALEANRRLGLRSWISPAALRFRAAP